MRHIHFLIPPILCGLLFSGCTADHTRAFTELSGEEKSQIEIVEEIMRASADGTRQIFSEMFGR
jgi:hypothetical protein